MTPSQAHRVRAKKRFGRATPAELAALAVYDATTRSTRPRRVIPDLQSHATTATLPTQSQESPQLHAIPQEAPELPTEPVFLDGAEVPTVDEVQPATPAAPPTPSAGAIAAARYLRKLAGELRQAIELTGQHLTGFGAAGAGVFMALTDEETGDLFGHAVDELCARHIRTNLPPAYVVGTTALSGYLAVRQIRQLPPGVVRHEAPATAPVANENQERAAEPERAASADEHWQQHKDDIL